MSNKQFTLPSSPSLAYFECVLDSFPLAILNSIVEKTKGPESKFDPYEADKNVVINRIIKHSIRGGFQLLAKSFDSDVANTIIHIYKPYLEQYHSKAELTSKYLPSKKEIIPEIWRRLGFDRFIHNLPIEIVHKLCESVGFREEVEDRESVELALKEELFIIGFCAVMRDHSELKHLQAALTNVRTTFKSLFDQYPFFEDSYCVADHFDGQAFGLFFLSFSFPHVRKEFIDYIQNTKEITKNLNNRALKKIQTLSFTNGNSEVLVTSSEKDAVQLLVENATKATQKETTPTVVVEEKKEKKEEKKEENKETPKEKPKEKKVRITEPSSSVSTNESSKPSTKRKKKPKQSTASSSDEENSNDENENTSKDTTLPSSAGRVKIEKGVTATEIYTNYTAKEIYDICKFFKIKLAGNSTERTRRIVKFLNDGIIEAKRKRKRSSSYGGSSKKSK